MIYRARASPDWLARLPLEMALQWSGEIRFSNEPTQYSKYVLAWPVDFPDKMLAIRVQYQLIVESIAETDEPDPRKQAP